LSEAAPQETLRLALQALVQKERSVAELGQWLRGRGVGEGEVEDVIDHLVTIETLDDARFAERFAADKRELSGWGSERIRAALLERGIAEADIDAALAGGDDELARAERLLSERGLDLSDERGRARALGLLARRGYEAEIAYEAINRSVAD
jgi:regulatory protein